MKKVERYFYPAIFTYAPGQEIAVDLMFRINISDRNPVGIIHRIPYGSSRYFLSHPSFFFAKLSISPHSFALPRIVKKTIIMISPSKCFT